MNIVIGPGSGYGAQAGVKAAGNPHMTIKANVDGLKARWANLTPRGKLLVAGGGGALLLLVVAAGNQGGPAPGQFGPGGYASRGGYGPGSDGGYQGAGFQGGRYQGAAPSYGAGSVAANDGDAADPTGYWARQRSQDQQAQAFGGYINDTTTVRDGDGTVHADVSNTYADPAIANGSVTAVPTSELPTSTPEPAPSTDP